MTFSYALLAAAALSGTVFASCPADYNSDGVVDAADLGLLLVAWDTANASIDLDGDGVVTGADLGLLVGAWGTCESDEPDLERVFAAPTESEIAAVRAEWASRALSPADWTIMLEQTFGGMRTQLISHSVNGETHYGFVRLPQEYNSKGSYPVLILNHGGNNGASFGMLGQISTGCYREFIVIVPSFPGERLDTGPFGQGELLSGGEESTFDLDVDCSIAMLNGVLAFTPGADATRIAVNGGSRGGGVSYLMSVRDERVGKACILFGATDHLTHPGLKEQIIEYVEGGMEGGYPNPVVMVAMRWAVEAYLEGKATFEETRLALLRRSVLFFAEALPAPLDVHHGTADNAVDVAHSQRLAERMAELGATAPDFVYYEYPGGGHGTNMPEAFDRQEAFLCE